MANGKQDELDRALDAALAKYAAAEPRSGLEDRVLANLRVERAGVRDRAWWRWSVLAVLAAMVIVALALRSDRPAHPVVAIHPSVPASTAPQSPMVRATQVASLLRPARKANARRSQSLVATADQAKMGPHMGAPPKLDQFPSPQPLSEQEKLLQSYVAKYPEQAVLIARARTEALRQDQLEEMAAIPAPERTMDSTEERNGTAER